MAGKSVKGLQEGLGYAILGIEEQSIKLRNAYKETEFPETENSIEIEFQEFKEVFNEVITCKV